MSDKTLYLIDATAFCYRAFYALKGLSTSFGQPTNAIYGFISILSKVLKDKKPEYLAACFDVSRETFRQKKFAQYKIQRPPMPEGLSGQIPIIKEIIQAYSIPIYEMPGFEADDVIASLSRRAEENGFSVVIVSSDKDILQLVDNNIQVFSPYKDAGTTYDVDKVRERFGTEPAQIPDIIGLMGDDADNIPGVKGIGEKTAVELIKRFKSVDNLLKNIDSITQEKLRSSIKDNTEMIRLSRELALLDDKIGLDFEVGKLKSRKPDYEALTRLFKQFEFKSLLKDIPAGDTGHIEAVFETIRDTDLKKFLGDADEVCLSGESFASLIFSAGEKYFRVDAPAGNTLAVLSDAGIKKSGYDLKKLKVSLSREAVSLNGLDFDVMLAAYILNPSKSGYHILEIAWDYLGENINPEIFTGDKALILTKKLIGRLRDELKAKDLESLYENIEMPLVSVLADIELTGIKVDLKVLEHLSKDIEKRLIKLIEQIYALSGTQFNINSTKQLRDVLFEKLKLPVLKKSKTGPSTDEEVLRGLSSRHKLPGLILEYRMLMKLKNTYIDALPQLVDQDTGRIHTTFNQAGTETGRLSSLNPNLQNIPIKTDIGRQIRRAIVAFSKEDCLLSCDYSQVELRILAHLCEDKNLISAFKEGRDIHRATAALIYGIEEAEVTQKMREMAKRINFGIVYGLTSFGLSRDLGIPVDEAQAFIDAYFARYPSVKDYIHQQIENTQKQMFVTTISGRRRYLPEIKNKNQAIRQLAERQAVNTPIQGSASDLIKLAMIKIEKELRGRKLNSKMILQIHDELLFNVPAAELGEVVSLTREMMENVWQLKVPIRVDIKKGKNWLEMEEVK